jgi:DNA-binding MarR family transcriptional regulator
MSQEEIIKDHSSDDNCLKAVAEIRYTHGWLNNHMNDEFDQFDVTVQQFNVLRILRDEYPNSQTINMLKERMVDKMPDLSRIVDRLLAKNMVSRCTNGKDRRAVDIRISDSGLKLLSLIDSKLKTSDLIKENLSEDELRQLCRLLHKLRGQRDLNFEPAN